MPKPSRNPRSTGDIDVHLGKRLRTARLQHGITQTDLADALGVTFQQVQKYEQGTNRISAARLFDMANVFDVPLDYFFEGLTKKAPVRKRRGGAARGVAVQSS